MEEHFDTVRIGLFGIGLDAYWPQFEGLRERLVGYLDQVSERIARPDVELVNLGLIDESQKSTGSRPCIPSRRCGPHLPLCDNLCAFIDRIAGRAKGQGAGHHPQPATGIRYRLRCLQQPRRPHCHDRRDAGPLLRLPRPRARQRLPTLRHLLLSSYRFVGRPTIRAGATWTTGLPRLRSPTRSSTIASASWAITTMACSTSTAM